MGHQIGKLSCNNCPSKGEGIFCELKDKQVENVDNVKIDNYYKKGQTLFAQGNPPLGVYCIKNGNIKVTQIGLDGKETIVRIATKGDIIGHRSVFSAQNYQATATALEDTQICFIDKASIMKLVQSEPSVAANIIGKLGKDLGAAEHRLSSFSQKSVKERLAEFLLLLKESHGIKEESTERIKLNIRLTREEMASIIGTAPETLIRFITQLKKEGVIDQEGKTLFVSDEEKLLQIADLPY